MPTGTSRRSDAELPITDDQRALLQSLGVAGLLEKGKLPLGWLCSTRIQFAAALLPEYSTARKSLVGLSRLIASRSDPHEEPFDISRAAHSYVGALPIWASMMPNGLAIASHISGDGIRALVLLAVLSSAAGKPVLSQSSARTLHPLIKKCDDATPWFADPLNSFLAAPGESSKNTLLSKLSAVPEQFSAVHIDELRRLLNSVYSSAIASYETVGVFLARERRVQFSQPTESDEYGYFLPAQHGSESTDTTRYTLGSAEQTRFHRRVERLASGRSGALIERALTPDTDGSLHPAEIKACWHELVSSLNSSIRTERLAALIWALMISTSWSRAAIWEELCAAQSGRNSKIRRVDGKCYFTIEIPGIATRRALPQELLGDNFRPDRELTFPLPAEVQIPIKEFFQSPDSFPSASDLQSSIDLIKARLRQITPRLTEGRVRRNLPVELFRLCHDPCMVMSATGENFGMSDAPLAYFSAPFGTLVSAREQALSTIGARSVATTDLLSDPKLVGAPLTAVTDERFKTLVKQFQSDCRAASAKSDEAWCDALTIYTARMWLAATGHRGQWPLSSILFGDVDPQGFTVMQDKPNGGGPGVRPVIIPKTLIRQLGVLFTLRSKIQGRRETRAAADWPIFRLLKSDRELKSSDIRHEASSGLPLNAFRSHLAVKLRAKGIHPRLVYWQLGHIWQDLAPVDNQSIDALTDIHIQLASKVDEVLLDDGWTVQGAQLIHGKNLTALWPMPNTAEPFLKNWDAQLTEFNRMAREREAKAKALSNEHRASHQEWVTLALQNVAPRHSKAEPVKGVKVEQHHVDRWLASLQSIFPEPRQIARCLALLSAELKRLRKKRGWFGLLPPQAFRREVRPPHVGAPHIRAARVAHEIRNRLVQPARFKEDTNPVRRWTRLAVLLILDRAVRNVTQLEAVLSDIADGNLGSDRSLKLFIGGRKPRFVVLRRETSLLVQGLQGNGEPPSIASLATSIKYECDLAGMRLDSNPLRSLIEMAQMASRVTVAGVHWMASDRVDPGTLSPVRAIDWVQERQGSVQGSDPEEKTADTPNVSKIKIPPDNAKLPSAYDAYKETRLKLWKLTEPKAHEQGKVYDRYRKARALLTGKAIDRKPFVVQMLLRFAASYLEDSSERTRIKYAYDSMVSMGSNLIRELGDRNIEEQNSLDLEDLYVQTLISTPEASQAIVGHNLERLHNQNSAMLAEVEFDDVLEAARVPPPSGVRAQIITATEYAAMRKMIRSNQSINRISMFECLQRLVITALIYRLGLRTAEATHARMSDVYEIAGGCFFQVHASWIGLLKTGNAQRIVLLDDHLTPEELSELRELRRLTLEIWPARDVSKPLFYFGAKSGLPELLDDLRRLVAESTGHAALSLHALRHSVVSRSLDHLMAADFAFHPINCRYVQSMVSCARLGHGSLNVGPQHYWHNHWNWVPLGSPLSAEAIGSLLGVKPNTLRQRASRQARTVVSDAPSEPLSKTILDEVGDKSPTIALGRRSSAIDPERPEKYHELIVQLALGRQFSVVAHNLRISHGAGREFMGYFFAAQRLNWLRVFPKTRGQALSEELLLVVRDNRMPSAIPNKSQFKAMLKFKYPANLDLDRQALLANVADARAPQVSYADDISPTDISKNEESRSSSKSSLQSSELTLVGFKAILMLAWLDFMKLRSAPRQAEQ